MRRTQHHESHLGVCVPTLWSCVLRRYRVSPVRPCPSPPVAEAYFTKKEIIGKKRKNRGEVEQKRTEDIPVAPPVPWSCVAFAASVGHVPSHLAYCCTLRKRGNRKEEEWVEEASRKIKKKTEDVPVGRVCPSVLSCVAVTAGVVPLLSVVSRVARDWSPVSQSTAPCRRREGARERIIKHIKQPDLTFRHPKSRSSCQE